MECDIPTLRRAIEIADVGGTMEHPYQQDRLGGHECGSACCVIGHYHLLCGNGFRVWWWPTSDDPWAKIVLGLCNGIGTGVLPAIHAVQPNGSLHGANLRGMDLIGVDISEADLSLVNLTRANLHGAYMVGTCLAGADLTDSSFVNADLRGANLDRANMSWVDMTGANLQGSNLHGVNLHGADLTGVVV